MSTALAQYTLGDVVARDGFVRRQRASATDDLGIARAHVIARLETAPGAPVGSVVEASIEAARALPVEHVVPIRDSGRDPSGQPYVVTAPVEGTSLAERLGAGPLPRAEALHLALDLARTLERAHGSSPPLVHGAIRPSAVLVDAKGYARLDDYGLGAVMAEVAQADARVLDEVARYLAPECASAGGAPAPASDVFGLASTLYEAITGRPAFSAETAVAILMRISMGKRPEVDPQIGVDLHALLASCWAKAPQKRPSATALVRALEALAGEDPRVAPPPPAPRPRPRGASLELDLEEPEGHPNEVTLMSVEVPNHIPSFRPYEEESVPTEPGVRLSGSFADSTDVPTLARTELVSIPESRPLAEFPRVDALEEMPTMKGESMALAQILAHAPQAHPVRPTLPLPIPVPIVRESAAPLFTPTVAWALVGAGALVVLVLVTTLAVLLGS